MKFSTKPGARPYGLRDVGRVQEPVVAARPAEDRKGREGMGLKDLRKSGITGAQTDVAAGCPIDPYPGGHLMLLPRGGHCLQIFDPQRRPGGERRGAEIVGRADPYRIASGRDLTFLKTVGILAEDGRLERAAAEFDRDLREGATGIGGVAFHRDTV